MQCRSFELEPVKNSRKLVSTSKVYSSGEIMLKLQSIIVLIHKFQLDKTLPGPTLLCLAAISNVHNWTKQITYNIWNTS